MSTEDGTPEAPQEDFAQFTKEDLARHMIRLMMRNNELERALRRLLAGKPPEDDDRVMQIAQEIMEVNEELLRRPEMADQYDGSHGVWLVKNATWLCNCSPPGDRRQVSMDYCSACGALRPSSVELDSAIQEVRDATETEQRKHTAYRQGWDGFPDTMLCENPYAQDPACYEAWKRGLLDHNQSQFVKEKEDDATAPPSGGDE
jgi:hypothetical protein